MYFLVGNDMIAEVKDAYVISTSGRADINDAEFECTLVYRKEDSDNLITAMTNASPIVVTSAGHGLSNGDKVLIRFAEGNTAANDSVWTVANKTTDTFELSGSTGNGTWTSRGEWWLVVPGSESVAMGGVTGDANTYRGTQQGSLPMRLKTQYLLHIKDVNNYEGDVVWFPDVTTAERKN